MVKQTLNSIVSITKFNFWSTFMFNFSAYQTLPVYEKFNHKLKFENNLSFKM